MNTVIFESVNHISYIYLNRPDRFNALNQEMLKELLDVIEQVEQNEDHVVIISGKGRAFSAGGDINMMGSFTDKESYDEIMNMISQIALKLYLMPKMVISAVEGSAVGLGLSVALTADHVVAGKDAKFGMLFLGVGLAPDGGGHFWLEERLGAHQAKQFTWGMQQVNSEQARAMNLVDMVTDEAAIDKATKLAMKLQSLPMVSMIKTKMTYHKRKEETLKYYLETEKQNQWELASTKDHQEGVQAFLEKRKPRFIGE